MPPSFHQSLAPRDFPIKTILHTEASLGWGGQEIRLLTEAAWFADHGFDVHLAAPAHSSLARRLDRSTVKFHPLGFSKSQQLLDTIRLGRIIRKLKPDVIATHSSVDSWVGLLAGRVYRPRSLRIRYRHVSTPVKPRLQNRWLYRSLCHRVITTAECTRIALIDTLGISPDRILSIPTGLPAPELPIDREATRASLISRLNLNVDSRFIGQVSVLRSWKGHPDLLDAFALLAPAYPQHHLFLLGDGPQRERLQTLRLAHPFASRIHFLGHLEEVGMVLPGFDVSILSSFGHEGVPQSGIQAFQYGVPFVGTRCGGIPELIGEEEQRGWLAEPSNPSALAAAIRRAFQPDQRVCAAQAYVASHHSPETMGQKVLQAFHDAFQTSQLSSR
ncbi:MAG: glycosyltransferase family 4 protein [Puniceicoccaceae bacterium]